MFTVECVPKFLVHSSAGFDTLQKLNVSHSTETNSS